MHLAVRSRNFDWDAHCAVLFLDVTGARFDPPACVHFVEADAGGVPALWRPVLSCVEGGRAAARVRAAMLLSHRRWLKTPAPSSVLGTGFRRSRVLAKCERGEHEHSFPLERGKVRKGVEVRDTLRHHVPTCILPAKGPGKNEIE